MRDAAPANRTPLRLTTTGLLLALLAPALLALGAWQPGHDHPHGSHDATGGWVVEVGEHQPHDRTQLEAPERLHRELCPGCLGQLRHCPALLTRSESADRFELRQRRVTVPPHPAVEAVFEPRQPRAPPVA
jgi:hypothetical protein